MSKKEIKETLEKDKVMLVFQKIDPQMLQTAGLPKPIQTAAIELDELLKWFKSYKVDSIELSIEGTAKTGTIPNLFISRREGWHESRSQTKVVKTFLST